MKEFMSFFVLWGLLGPASVHAAAPPAFTASEVGIDEKLGGQVPLDLVLKDEEGRPVLLGNLLGKPTVLTLNYFRCAGICTPLLNGVVDVLNQVKANPGQDFQVITVSFDPRDTPEIAFQKRTNYLKEIQRPVSPPAWRFLTGEAAATKALCDAVGFKFKAQGGDFIHAGAIMILSPQGKVTRYMYGVTFLPADLQMAILEASRGEARPTINKWLQFCYSADPSGRGFVFSTTKTVASITILLAAIFAAVLVFRKPRAKEKKA
jgi:protein SCO1